jgi:hypothetical protein
MKKLTFLLLDANVVIFLFKVGIWDALVAECDIRLARTVMREAHFYEDDRGARVDFDLAPYERDGRIAVFEVPLPEITAFREDFDASYLERLDPGETESLACLTKASTESQLCSGDSIVFRVLGNLDRGERGVSLEEVLRTLGRSRALPRQFTKAFREQWTARGVEERLRGTGALSRK